MFKFARLGLHYAAWQYGAMDPMVLEMIRTERLMRAAKDAERESVREHHAANDETDTRLDKAA